MLASRLSLVNAYGSPSTVSFRRILPAVYNGVPGSLVDRASPPNTLR
jgi:hypothetical protein